MIYLCIFLSQVATDGYNGQIFFECQVLYLQGMCILIPVSKCPFMLQPYTRKPQPAAIAGGQSPIFPSGSLWANGLEFCVPLCTMELGCNEASVDAANEYFRESLHFKPERPSRDATKTNPRFNTLTLVWLCRIQPKQRHMDFRYAQWHIHLQVEWSKCCTVIGEIFGHI
jgi:hypothetical protein